jgi:hypothetical protein
MSSRRKFDLNDYELIFIIIVFVHSNRQEQAAAELANEAQAIEVGLCGSNSQLNTGERSH